MFRKIRDNLWGVLAFVGLIWVVFAVSFIVDMKPLALQPRSAQGLIGILLMPFLHQDLNHLLGNTVPLTVLLFMLRATRKSPWRIIMSLIVGAGVLLWVLGRTEKHMG
ncbi:MAG: rhomboid family intramembrane serine protease, partial [Planctomycetia bacterium]